jgi:hypothetical protein
LEGGREEAAVAAVRAASVLVAEWVEVAAQAVQVVVPVPAALAIEPGFLEVLPLRMHCTSAFFLSGERDRV